MLLELQDKNADIENLAGKALKDDNLLSELLEGLKSKVETYRYNCYKVLYSISKNHPKILYPEWDRFAASLSSDNSYHKMSAVHLIANLTRVDVENRFEKIFDTYYGLLDDRSMVVAYYTAASSGKIVAAKPALKKQVTDRLLGIDGTHHTPGRKELIKTGVIEALGEYIGDSEDRDRIIKFVEQQLNSESRKTRKTAAEFLKKWGNS